MRINIIRVITFSFFLVLFLTKPTSLSANCTEFCTYSWVPPFCMPGLTKCQDYVNVGCYSGSDPGSAWKCCDTVDECAPTTDPCASPNSCEPIANCPGERFRTGACAGAGDICCAPPPGPCVSPNTCVDVCPHGQTTNDYVCSNPGQTCCEPTPTYCGNLGEQCCPSGQACNSLSWACDTATGTCVRGSDIKRQPANLQPVFCGKSTNPNVGSIDTAIGCISVKNNQKFIEDILKYLMGIAGGLAFVLIVYSGFIITTSSGDPKRIAAGKELLSAAIAGLLLLILGTYLLRVIGVNILGIF